MRWPAFRRVQSPRCSRLEAEYVHQFARQHLGIARLLDLHLAQHLADDDLDVLVGNVNALQAVNDLHFLEQIVLHALDAFDLQDVVRVDGAFGQLVAGLDQFAVRYTSALAP